MNTRTRFSVSSFFVSVWFPFGCCLGFRVRFGFGLLQFRFRFD